MVLRIILLTLLLILLILLFAPLCVRLAFDDGDFRWSARYLFLRKSSGAPKHAQHPPEHPEHQKEPAPVKQTAAPTDKPPRTPAADAGKPGQEAAAPEASGKEQEPVQEESAQAETEKKSGGFLSKYKPQSLSEWVELILNLLHAAGRPLRWLLRRITIRDIDLDFIVSHPDALRQGEYCRLQYLGAAVPVLPGPEKADPDTLHLQPALRLIPGQLPGAGMSGSDPGGSNRPGCAFSISAAQIQFRCINPLHPVHADTNAALYTCGSRTSRQKSNMCGEGESDEQY